MDHLSETTLLKGSIELDSRDPMSFSLVSSDAGLLLKLKPAGWSVESPLELKLTNAGGDILDPISEICQQLNGLAKL